MAGSSSEGNVVPVPAKESGSGSVRGGEEREIIRENWWKKVLEVEEAKQQILFSLPMILNNGFYYMIPLI